MHPQAKTSEAGDASPLSLGDVGLHPDRHVDQVRVLALAGAHALHDDERQPRRHGDLTRSAVLTPGGRDQTDRLATMQRPEHLLEQVAPGEERLVPGEVIGVHHRRARYRSLQPGRQRRLPRGAATVDGDDARACARWTSSVPETVEELGPVHRLPAVDGGLTRR